MNIFNSTYQDYIATMNEKDFVLIDPPWNYNDNASVRNNKVKPAFFRRQVCYERWDNQTGLEQIFKNCKSKHILLWSTNSMLIDIMRANHYNYIYKTIVTWVKLTAKEKIWYGLGYSFRNSTEQLLLFSRKKEKPIRLAMRSVLHEKWQKRTGKPKNWELLLFQNLEEKGLKKFSYIFSGNKINCFKALDIDLVDINFTEENYENA